MPYINNVSNHFDESPEDLMSVFSKIFGTNVPVSLEGSTDWHCHILPGVDDGVRTMEESLSILNQYERAGVKTVWLTPHIMEDVPNTTAKLRERFDELRQAYKGSIELHLAAENMLDNLFAERLEANDLLPIGENGDMLLVETSYFNAPLNMESVLQEIMRKGYFPLIAHPERYFYITDMQTYSRWKDLGARLQLNLLSLGGHYGADARDKAIRLLSDGMYDCAGSDLHRSQQTEMLNKLTLPKKHYPELQKLRKQ